MTPREPILGTFELIGLLILGSASVVLVLLYLEWLARPHIPDWITNVDEARRSRRQ